MFKWLAGLSSVLIVLILVLSQVEESKSAEVTGRIVTVIQTNVLNYRTRFHESQRKYGIFMPCNSVGRPTCMEAIIHLANLTNSDECQQHFFISVVDGNQFVKDETAELQVYHNPGRVVFATRGHGGEDITLRQSVVIGQSHIDCRRIMYSDPEFKE